MKDSSLLEHVEGLYSIRLLKLFRKTPKVTFDFAPIDALKGIHAIDRVLHEPGASSPGAVGHIERPWYMHPYQEDNLIVLFGTRHIELYTPEHGRIEAFTITPSQLIRNGRVICNEGVMLSWPVNVFHRVLSGPEGSAAVNIAFHHDGFDIRNNFNIYDLNTETGKYSVVRAGHLDQREE